MLETVNADDTFEILVTDFEHNRRAVRCSSAIQKVTDITLVQNVGRTMLMTITGGKNVMLVTDITYYIKTYEK